MTINVDFPQPFEDALRAEWGDLGGAVKEALIIESYRRGRISLGYVAELLELNTTIEAQAWLASRKVPLNYDLSDLQSDDATIERLTRNGD
jgi:predicted HTH domain antitoxin